MHSLNEIQIPILIVAGGWNQIVQMGALRPNDGRESENEKKDEEEKKEIAENKEKDEKKGWEK